MFFLFLFFFEAIQFPYQPHFWSIFFFHQMPEFSNCLDISMLGNYQKKKNPNADDNFQENKAPNEWDAYAFPRMGQ